LSRTRRPPYWLLIAFLALLALPAWVTTALVAASVALAAGRAVGFLTGRHRREGRPEGAIVLGRDRRGREVSITERELSAHGLILGASGAGKTTTLLTILTEQIRRGRPVLVVDMKGSPELAARLAEAAGAAGRPFKLWSPDGPNHWNPLQYGNATELKDKLISTERFTEPHYQRAAERYVQNVLQVLEHVHPGRGSTLEEVVRLMDPNRLPGALRSLPPALTERVHDYLAGLTPDQLSAIRGLQTRLAIVTESHTGPYLAPPRDSGAGRGDASAGETVDVRHALAGREVVLFSLNAGTYGQLAVQLGTLAVQDVICATGHRLAERANGRQQELALVAIDESSLLGDHLVALFARGREGGVATLAATQEMADFDRAARGLRDQVLGNTAVKVAHRQDVPASAQVIAQMAGTEKAWEETEQIGGSLLTGYPGNRGTRRQVDQFVVHPNEIKSLGTGDAVLISKLRGGRAQTIRIDPPPPRRARIGQPPTRRAPERPGAERGI
jgi:conjugal transfer pilus assembly protein TraD